MAIEDRVRTSRFGRLSLMGQLAGGIVSGALNEGVSQLLNGRRPSLKNMLLTPDNAKRLSNRLSQMRGAAMKIGQLMSMDSGQILPAEFSQILNRLRDDAHIMPLGQVDEVLNQSLGKGWEAHFEQFIFTPIAAASIGQVHKAKLKDGRSVAVKIQYPGIVKSIDSDVDNVAGLLNIFQLLPEHLNVTPLLNEAKQQLHFETDYLREADALGQFAALVSSDDRFAIPQVVDELTKKEVLTMTYMKGQPIETVFHSSGTERNRIARNILELNLNEVFIWGVVQTDPNFANYRYENDTGVIQLLDFGATRFYNQDQIKLYQMLMKAAIEGENSDIIVFAEKIGYLLGNEPDSYKNNLIDLLLMVSEPFRARDSYDFGRSDLAVRMQQSFFQMRLNNNYGTLPPVDVLFLHRKLAGLYLLLSQLQAKLPIRNNNLVNEIIH